MEVLVELVFEIIGQLVVELLIYAGLRGLARLLSNPVAQAVLGFAIALGGGYGGGYWWGSRLTRLGRTDPPKSLWVSAGLAVVFIALALVKGLRDQPADEVAPTTGLDLLLPWRWSPTRLLGFATLNTAVGIGIAVGFTPQALR